ncbi:MAG: glycosyltransferase, partial [Thermodesulfobacteriota bacterium]
GYDYVTPIYSRNKYDGTITNHICYPLLYSLFNTNIRQPIGGEFAFSPEMVELWLSLEWKDCIKEYGIDIFMTTSALLNGFKRCQVALGSKVHKPSAPKLGPMFTQVVTTLFDSLCRFKDSWIGLEEIKDSPLFGQDYYQEPQPMSVDYEKLMKNSLEGFMKYNEILSTILSPFVYNRLKGMYEAKIWDIDSELWSKMLYDFIVSYDIKNDKASVVEALKPLYFARVASYYKKTLNVSSVDAEKEFHTQAKQFRSDRSYLVEKVRKYCMSFDLN